MATVMEFNAPASEFPLGSIFEEFSGVTVELERIIPHDAMIIPYFWVRGAEVGDIESEFENHPGVTDIKLVDTVEEEYLMRAKWDRSYVGILSALSASNVVVLSGVGTSEGWHFEVRSEDRSGIAGFRTYCQDNGIPIDITAVHELRPVKEGEYELTDTQREALVLAYERGYFDSPRETSLSEIAAELGITQQSLSSRLRRGHRRLVGGTIAA